MQDKAEGQISAGQGVVGQGREHLPFTQAAADKSGWVKGWGRHARVSRVSKVFCAAQSL